MKAVLAAFAALLLTTALPAWAQSRSSETESSDRYRRDVPDADVRDQQARTPRERDNGQIETLRRDNMTAPNVRGEQVPENPATGAAAPEQGPQPERHEGGIRP